MEVVVPNSADMLPELISIVVPVGILSLIVYAVVLLRRISVAQAKIVEHLETLAAATHDDQA